MILKSFTLKFVCLCNDMNFNIHNKKEATNFLIIGRQALVHLITPNMLTSLTNLYKSIELHSTSPYAEAPALLTTPHKPEC